MVPSKFSISYATNIFLGLAVIGFLLVYFLRKEGGGIYGYSVITASIISIIIYEMALKKHQIKSQNLSTIWLMLKYSFPLMIVVGISSWLVAINIIYEKDISSDVLPQEYITFQNITTILILIQIYLIYLYISDQSKEGKADSIMTKIYKFMSENISLVMTLISFIMFIVVGIMQVIIEYFRTDG